VQGTEKHTAGLLIVYTKLSVGVGILVFFNEATKNLGDENFND